MHVLLKLIQKLIKLIVMTSLLLSAMFIAPKLEDMVTRQRMSSNSQAVVSFVHPKMLKRRFGTGFSIKYKNENLVITNKHVCNAGRRYNKHLYMKDADNNLLIGKHYHISKIHDLCIIRDIKGKSYLKLGKINYPQQEIFILGHPWGNDLVIRKGYVNGIQNSYFRWIGLIKVDHLFLNLIAYPGNSGSPLVNYWGRVVGVLFAGRPGAWSETMAVPLANILLELEIYSKAIKNGLPKASKIKPRKRIIIKKK